MTYVRVQSPSLPLFVTVNTYFHRSFSLSAFGERSCERRPRPTDWTKPGTLDSAPVPVSDARIRFPQSAQLRGWSGHPDVYRLQKRLTLRKEAGDQEDERLIAGIAEGMHDAGLLDDPLPWPQQHLGPRRNHLGCGRGSESAPPRFAFLVQDGVGTEPDSTATMSCPGCTWGGATKPGAMVARSRASCMPGASGDGALPNDSKTTGTASPVGVAS